MEVDNAINGMQREIKQRFDLKGTKCDIERTDNTLTMIAENTMQLTQLEDLLRKYLGRRNVDQRAIQINAPQNAAGGTIRTTIFVRQGIEPDLSRKIVDPYTSHNTLILFCDILDAVNKNPYERDPRGIAKKAEAYLKKSGVGDKAYLVQSQNFLYLMMLELKMI